MAGELKGQTGRQAMSADVLREAAQRPYAPPRLLRAADKVVEGAFSWEDVASGRCAHPVARSLFTAKAHETLWPFLREVAGELDAEPAEPVAQDKIDGARGPGDFDDEDFSATTYLQHFE